MTDVSCSRNSPTSNVQWYCLNDSYYCLYCKNSGCCPFDSEEIGFQVFDSIERRCSCVQIHYRTNALRCPLCLMLESARPIVNIQICRNCSQHTEWKEYCQDCSLKFGKCASCGTVIQAGKRYLPSLKLEEQQLITNLKNCELAENPNQQLLIRWYTRIQERVQRLIVLCSKPTDSKPTNSKSTDSKSTDSKPTNSKTVSSQELIVKLSRFDQLPEILIEPINLKTSDQNRWYCTLL